MIFFLACTNAFSQGRFKHFNDKDNIKTYVVRSSDTIVVDQDSVMVMNRKTYILYESLRRNNATYKSLSIAYDSLLKAKETLYQNQISKQDSEYNRLRGILDSVAIHSINVSNSTSNSLSEIRDSLTASAQILNQAKANLIKTQKDLKKEKVQKILGRFYWGLGGLGIGIAGTALALLLLHK